LTISTYCNNFIWS